MKRIKSRVWLTALIALAGIYAPVLAQPVAAQQSQQGAVQSANRRVGAIKAINGTTMTLALDSGAEAIVTVQDTTKVVRIAPGETTLKNATPLRLQDLQVGDRILVAGSASDGGKLVTAATIVVIKRTELQQRDQQNLQDWQRRGTSGVVTEVDPSAGKVTISVASLSSRKDILIRTSKDTVLRRYAPDSVKFSEAKPATLQDIHLRDQLRARGDRNADGSELTAEEIVVGTFPYVEGAIKSTDANASMVSVQDVLSKKIVTVKVTPDSQLRVFPPEMAQRFAMRLKGQSAGVSGISSAGSAAQPEAGKPPFAGAAAGGRNSSPDLQQMLNHLPPATFADLHKDDVVLILSTPGTPTVSPSVITLLGGVEPILRAAPSGSESTILGAWSLGAPVGDAGSQ